MSIFFVLALSSAHQGYRGLGEPARLKAFGAVNPRELMPGDHGRALKVAGATRRPRPSSQREAVVCRPHAYSRGSGK